MLRAWPPAVVQRVVSLADDVALAKSMLLKQYTAANADSLTLLRFTSGSSSSRCKPRISHGTNRVAFVLRFHPAFQYALKQACKLAPMPLEFELDFMPSWTNALPSTTTFIVRARSSEFLQPDVQRSRDGGRADRCCTTFFLLCFA